MHTANGIHLWYKRVRTYVRVLCCMRYELVFCSLSATDSMYIVYTYIHSSSKQRSPSYLIWFCLLFAFARMFFSSSSTHLYAHTTCILLESVLCFANAAECNAEKESDDDDFFLYLFVFLLLSLFLLLFLLVLRILLPTCMCHCLTIIMMMSFRTSKIYSNCNSA